MKVKVTEYNIHNGAIRWRIATSVKVAWRIFALALIVSEILMFQPTFAMVPFDRKY